jgi:hypothetical protein
MRTNPHCPARGRSANQVMRRPLFLLVVLAGCGSHAPSPSDEGLPHHPAPAYDVWGRAVFPDEVARLTPAERAQLTPEHGAVAIDRALLARGRQAFYEETFGNEIFLSDVLGVLRGPLRPWGFVRALLALRGRGTTDLQVRLSENALVGGRLFRRGELVSTGLDVPRGGWLPLGIKVRLDGTHLRMGLTCAACHSTVDPASGRVVHGAPNTDLRAGLLLALASNSAAFFTHTGVDPRALPSHATYLAADGARHPLVDQRAMEDAVDADFLAWPPGSFDSMTDLVANPSQIPSSFTWQSHPFSISGAFMAGPFHGLSSQNNNVHALNADATTEADGAPARFGIDTDLFLAVLLRNAPEPRYRFDPRRAQRARTFLDEVDPTPGQPGLNQMVALPAYPRATVIEPTSLLCSLPGEPIWRSIDAMSAWQNTLIPPPPPQIAGRDVLQRGRRVFESAGCTGCHDGPALTDHRVLPASTVGTQPLRARALRSTSHVWDGRAVIYASDQIYPWTAPPRTVSVPPPDPAQLGLAYGWTEGGFKVPGLVGLYWTAPYLHDGGVAVGTDLARAGGGVVADPRNSLLALIDRDLRTRVVAANHASPELTRMGVEGIGHEQWVDRAAGFDAADQRALVEYLLAFTP